MEKSKKSFVVPGLIIIIILLIIADALFIYVSHKAVPVNPGAWSPATSRPPVQSYPPAR